MAGTKTQESASGRPLSEKDSTRTENYVCWTWHTLDHAGGPGSGWWLATFEDWSHTRFTCGSVLPWVGVIFPQSVAGTAPSKREEQKLSDAAVSNLSLHPAGTEDCQPVREEANSPGMFRSCAQLRPIIGRQWCARLLTRRPRSFPYKQGTPSSIAPRCHTLGCDDEPLVISSSS